MSCGSGCASAGGRPLERNARTAAAVHGRVTAHRHRAQRGPTDEYSSAAWFDGWDVPPTQPAAEPPVAPARTWLLTVGWRDRGGGPIGRAEMPSS
ncbi:MAG TPA: hypothetical protein VKE22_14060 [Haliangiales bacterium]|nr:hypothetical protein [Haliangiales bacterium]